MTADSLSGPMLWALRTVGEGGWRIVRLNQINALAARGLVAGDRGRGYRITPEGSAALDEARP